MNKLFVLLTGIFMLHIAETNAQLPNVASGKIERYADFKSAVIEARNVDVWLPADYSPSKKYAVLYMHDGQMLFDSSTTWNKQEWHVDETVSKLIAEGKIMDCIVVGIWNNGIYRHADYFPQKPLADLPSAARDTLIKNELQGKPRSDAYLQFIVSELKPFIDKTYSTYTDKSHTFIAGSSMGGLISMYAICEYPEIFGGAACISTHWPGSILAEKDIIPDAFLNYLQQHLPPPTDHKIYFDYGTATLDQLYEPYQLKADAIMQAKNYTSTNWLTKKFEGENHSEASWSKRLFIPLIFLLAK